MTTTHVRKRSEETPSILSMESEASSSSVTSASKSRRLRSTRSPQSIAWIALTVSAASLVLSPALTLQTNRTLWEKHTLRIKSPSVAAAMVPKEVNTETEKLQHSESLQMVAKTAKPTILIHIGPPKTGTTTLQCHLGLNFANMVEKDNFYYLGTWYAPLCGLPLGHKIPGFANAPRPILLDCYAPHIQKKCSMDERWAEFGNLFQKHYDLGHNLIVSDEMFHHHFERDDVQRLKSLLESSWNVKIMYTYRHFYSSVPSMYHQLNDPYATEEGMANAVEKTIWPNEGGYRIRSFRESNDFEIERGMHQFSYWVEAFGTVQVFNMEESSAKGGYLSSFLCTMMPELKSSSCDTMVESTAASSDSSRNDNGSARKFLHYDMLAVAAKDAGLLDNTNLQRVEVRDAIQQHCEENGWNDLSNNFALDCLFDDEMASFLNASLDQAKMMQEYFVPSKHQDWSILEEEIRTGFWKHAERKQFCSIDTTASLKEERWQAFFRSMTETSTTS